MVLDCVLEMFGPVVDWWDLFQWSSVSIRWTQRLKMLNDHLGRILPDNVLDATDCWKVRFWKSLAWALSEANK